MGGHTRSGYGSGDDADPAADEAAGPRTARTVFGREIHLPTLRNDAQPAPPPSAAPALPTLTPVPVGGDVPSVRTTRGPSVHTLTDSEIDALRSRGTLRNLLVVLAAAAVSFTVVALWSWQRGRVPRTVPAPAVAPPAPVAAPRPVVPPPAPRPAAAAEAPVPRRAEPPPPVRRKPRAPRPAPVDPDAPLPFRL